MIEIKVGENFPLARVKEGAMIDLKEDGFHVFVGFHDVTDKEVLDFRKKKLQLDLSFINGIMFFVLEVGDSILADMPFHTGLIRPPSAIDAVTERSSANNYSLNLFLVDVKDNTLKAMRIIGLSEKFSEVIENLMNKQLEATFDKATYNKELNRIFNTLSTTGIREMSMTTFESKK